jgi:2-dehydro-3-deoxy-D-arabinonate dehydratase
MKLVHYTPREDATGRSFAGVLSDDARQVRQCGDSLTRLLEAEDPVAAVAAAATGPWLDLGGVTVLPPIERQEVWAAGVTYLRSKSARMEESEFSATAYDRVYEAERPEIFFKATPDKVVGPGGAIGVRRDSHWTVPEPELALYFNSRGQVVGCGVGNDVSARDIEGENLLYLPQAKIFTGSCALGPWITLGVTEAEVRSWTISLKVERSGTVVFAGLTEIGRLKRSFSELGHFLFASQEFRRGVVLLTGTGIVPPDDFQLQRGDETAISISGIGTLQNRVIVV